LNNLGRLDTEDVESSHAEYHCKLVVQFAQFGAVLVLLAQKGDFLQDFKLIDTEHKQIGAIDIQKVVTHY
jgi:hypothetical protein